MSKTNPDGLLPNDEKDYLDCLKIKHIKLEELLKRADAHWVENLKFAREKADKMIEEL